MVQFAFLSIPLLTVFLLVSALSTLPFVMSQPEEDSYEEDQEVSLDALRIFVVQQTTRQNENIGTLKTRASQLETGLLDLSAAVDARLEAIRSGLLRDTKISNEAFLASIVADIDRRLLDMSSSSLDMMNSSSIQAISSTPIPNLPAQRPSTPVITVADDTEATDPPPKRQKADVEPVVVELTGLDNYLPQKLDPKEILDRYQVALVQKVIAEKRKCPFSCLNYFDKICLLHQHLFNLSSTHSDLSHFQLTSPTPRWLARYCHKV